MYQAEGRYKDAFICNMQWLCDWNALECRVAQDFEIAQQEIRGTIQSLPGNNSKLQDSWRWRKFPLSKLSPSKLSPGKFVPPLYAPRVVRATRNYGWRLRCIDGFYCC